MNIRKNMQEVGNALTTVKNFYRRNKPRVLTFGTLAAATGVAAATCSVYSDIPLTLGAASFLLCVRKGFDTNFGKGIGASALMIYCSGAVSLTAKNYLDAEQIPVAVSQKIATVCLKPGLAFKQTSPAGKDYLAKVSSININKVTTLDASGKSSVAETYGGTIDVSYSYKDFYWGTKQTKTEHLSTPLYSGPYIPGSAQKNCWVVNAKPQ